jgi:hypothetical protein
MAELLPSSFSPTGARFQKPYTEIEYRGKLYPIKGMVGGHNGVVAQACQASAPVYDKERKTWVVPITNNLIDIDLAGQDRAASVFDAGSPLRQMKIVNNPDPGFASTGLLITSTRDESEPPAFPVDCEFQMFIRVTVPRRPALINIKPMRLIARGLQTWPPPVGTSYENMDGADLVPARLARLGAAMAPVIARILPGDQTVLTEVFGV